MSQVSRSAFQWDLWISMLGLAAGRLYPNLKALPVDLTDKVAIVTGSNSGIGLRVALDLAEQNATVYLACRNQTKAKHAIDEIIDSVPAAAGRLHSLALDTSSLASVRQFAETWKSLNAKIDILFHNAGIGDAGGTQFTTDGFPPIYETNFLGSFLLTHLLEQYLSNDARVILTTSTGQYGGTFSKAFSLTPTKNHLERGFHCPPSQEASTVTPSTEYTNSKAMQCAFAKLLTQRWARQAAETGGESGRRISHSFTPGFTSTPIFAKTEATSTLFSDPLFYLLRVTYTVLATPVQQGALTGVWLASTDDAEVVGDGKGGGYWDRMTRRISKVDLLSQETLDRMWIRWEADAGVEWR